MTPDRSGAQWDAEFKPHRTAMYAYGIAAVIAAAGIVVGLLSKGKSTGAALRTVDQFALAGIAIVLAGAVLLLTRPRLRVGPAGLAVRNIVDYRLIPWSEVADISFPPGRRWARVDLEYNEYMPILAIQTFDREQAVHAMDTVRDLMARYRSGTAH
jgi:hypothetical protein